MGGGGGLRAGVRRHCRDYINARSVKETSRRRHMSPRSRKEAFAEIRVASVSHRSAGANKSIDVIFQVAGLTGNGVLQAACEANIVAIGVDVDQFVSTPATAKCTAVSAEKKLKKNVSDAIVRIKDKKDKGGGLKLDLTTDDVGLSPFHDYESKITADTKAKIEKAIADMKAGSLQACPADNFDCPFPSDLASETPATLASGRSMTAGPLVYQLPARPNRSRSRAIVLVVACQIST